MTAAGFLEALLSLSLQAAIVVGVAAWLVRSAKAEPVGDRLWASCHVVLLCLIVAAFAFPHLRLMPHGIISRHVELVRASGVAENVGAALLFVWACGAGIGLVCLMIGTVQAARIVVAARPLPGDRLPEGGQALARLPQAARRRHAAAAIRVVSSPLVKSPFCWQIHRPIIVLPEFLLGLSDDELASIIRHEEEHLRAGHPLHLFLQRVVELLLWYHPLIWWASYQAARHREFHCDWAAVSSRRETAAYLRSLLRLAEHDVMPAGGMPAGLAFGASRTLTQQRAERLAKRDWNSGPAPRVGRLASLLLWAAALLATLLWVPVDLSASSRSVWSPCPRWTASALHLAGISIRDYEIDGHRLEAHHHLRNRQPESE